MAATDETPDPDRDQEPSRSRSGPWLPGRRGTLVAALILIVAVALSWLTGRSGNDDPLAAPARTATTATTSAASSDVLAMAALQTQREAVLSGERAAFVATANPRSLAARREAAVTYDNLTKMRLASYDTRYVAANVGGLTGQQQRKLGGGGWTADVEVSWQLRGLDTGPAQLTLTYTFVQRGDQAYVVSARNAADARTPVWLLGPLTVDRTPNSLLLALDDKAAPDLARLLRQAVGDVAAVVPRARAGLVLLAPATGAQFEKLLGSQAGQYNGIAAVTTTADGLRTPTSPVVIVTNPPVFDTLDPTGARVVISHESTHAATGAATSELPLWVAEGFADYVGIGAADVPVDVAAARELATVRNDGAPKTLPRDAEFGVGVKHLNRAYEAAWLTCRFLAMQYGEQKLVQFYYAVRDDPNHLGRAFPRVLGTTEATFTRQWGTYLTGLAG